MSLLGLLVALSLVQAELVQAEPAQSSGPEVVPDGSELDLFELDADLRRESSVATKVVQRSSLVPAVVKVIKDTLAAGRKVTE